jgi:VIT1/CCC1 family predicted Fe2+/Mn2+ transporter
MSRLPTHLEHHLVGRIGWMRAAVLGANDGIISTASLIVGVAAASAKQHDILIAGVAGLVAGAMSMAAGEYVSVSSQSDTEQADLARERAELSESPEAEHDELADIYVKRGVERGLARQVAQQLMAKDALATHARDELGDVGHHHGAPCASSSDVRSDVFDGRGPAAAHGDRIARQRACSHCLGGILALSGSFGSDRG